MEEITVLPDQSEILHYDDPSFPLYMKENALSLYSGKRVLCHWHQEMEFFLVEKGHPSYFANGNIVSLAEGEAIFVNSKCLHYGFSPDGTDSTYLVLVFLPSLLAPSPYLQDHYVEPISSEIEVPYLVFSKESVLSLKKEMEAMRLLLAEKKENFPLKVLSHLYAFWADFLSLKGREKPFIAPSESRTLLLKKMLAYLYAHYQEPLHVETIAASAGITSGYAIHLFQKFLHSSPIAYLNAYRLEKACELLADSDCNISEIAAEVGYESPSYFSELFRRNKGYSPREYLKRKKKDDK